MEHEEQTTEYFPIPDTIEWAGLSDRGIERQENQDAFGSTAEDEGRGKTRGEHLFIVADGMGGHKGGATASRMAVNIILKEYRAGSDPHPEENLRMSILAADRAIRLAATADTRLAGMGTTVVTLTILNEREALVGHVGDSRVYLVRGDSMRQLTRDHSLIQKLIDEGSMSLEEARTSTRKNVITRALGGSEVGKPDFFLTAPLFPGDSFILCSDGLHGVVTDDEISGIVREHRPLDACRLLVDLARERGGPDNITVVIVLWKP